MRSSGSTTVTALPNRSILDRTRCSFWLRCSLIAHAAMRFGTVAPGPMPDGRIERMAFGEYFATVLEEAMLLLRARARQRGATGLLRGADRRLDAAGVVWQSIPEAWEVFPPVDGEHGAA